MNNKELTAVMAQRMGCSVREVAELMTAFSSVMSTRLMDGDTVNLTGLGPVSYTHLRAHETS